MNEFLQELKDIIYDFVFKSSIRLIFVTFLLLCVVGGLLLYLPCCGDLKLIDAMFSSFSGVCVTGLSTIDITKDLTTLGQFVLLMLIQTGGLSIMSISSIIFFILGKKMSLSYEKNARSVFNADSRLEIKDSLFMVFKYTFFIELVGVIILFVRFLILQKSFLFALKNSVFLSISAFCNAGFALFSNNLVEYNNDPTILITIALLIILGGIAPAFAINFPKYLKREKLSPMCVIVFNTTLLLLVFGTLIYFISEYSNSLTGMNFIDKLTNSFFQSVTTRTAGFNSVDLSSINSFTYILFLFLMVVGGSPGGMAGGIKTTTFGVLVITYVNTFFKNKNIIRNKEIAPDTINKAITLIFIYFGVIAISTLILSTTQTISDIKLLFETVSAMGTVGLSMGITSQLDVVGKFVIILTMFLGRVLPAIYVCHLNYKSSELDINYPKAKIALT